MVGGPTHASGMSRPGAREDAVSQSGGAGAVSTGDGLREWPAAVQVPAQVWAATFDTRMDKPTVPGSTARAARQRLQHLGCRAVAPGMSFHVTSTRGPLVDGEIARSAVGQGLADRIPHQGPQVLRQSPNQPAD